MKAKMKHQPSTPFELAWEQGFAALKQFRAREKHCRVPRKHKEGAFNLGTWVINQRNRRDALPVRRKQRLDAIGFSWSTPKPDSGATGLAALKQFKSREGHCRVPGRHKEGTFNLGTWVINQRNRRDALPVRRKQRLDAIGFSWSTPKPDSWATGLAALKRFQSREGHCRVPRSYEEAGFKLGKWVYKQRRTRSTMARERRRHLDALGFVWNPLDQAWDEAFAALKQFKAREKHCRVPRSHQEETFNLGTWVVNQRNRRDALSIERRRRLDAIGFVWHFK